MSESEAQDITDAIRATATATYVLLSKAHEGKAYQALGYETWADYVKTEFDMSAQRSYQLLDLGKAVAMIEAATPEGTVVKLTEAQARDIKRELPRITEIIEEKTEDMEPEDASETVDQIIEDIRAAKKAEDARRKELEDAAAQDEDDDRAEVLDAAADAILAEDDERKELNADRPESMTGSADDGLVEVDVEGDGESDLNPEAALFVYNFFNTLTSISDLPEPDTMITMIPESRVDEVNEFLISATGWLNRFQTLWELRED